MAVVLILCASVGGPFVAKPENAVPCSKARHAASQEWQDSEELLDGSHVVGASRGNIEGSGVGGVGIGTLLQVGPIVLTFGIALYLATHRGPLVEHRLDATQMTPNMTNAGSAGDVPGDV